MPLTDITARKAKPTGKIQHLFDGGGMYLEISPAGGKWWRLKYRFGGKEKRLSLATHPTLQATIGQSVVTGTLTCRTTLHDQILSDLVRFA